MRGVVQCGVVQSWSRLDAVKLPRVFTEGKAEGSNLAFEVREIPLNTDKCLCHRAEGGSVAPNSIRL